MTENTISSLKLFFLLVWMGISISQTLAQPLSLELEDSIVAGLDDVMKPSSISSDKESIFLCYKTLRKVLKVQVNEGAFGSVTPIYENPSRKRYRNVLDALGSSLSFHRKKFLEERLEPELYSFGGKFHVIMNGLRAFVFDEKWKLLCAKRVKSTEPNFRNGNRNYEQSIKVAEDRENPESFWIGVEMPANKSGFVQLAVVKLSVGQPDNRKTRSRVIITKCHVLPLKASLVTLYRLGFYWDFDINSAGETLISFAGTPELHLVNGNKSRMIGSSPLSVENTLPEASLSFAQKQFQFTLKNAQNTGISFLGKGDYMIRTKLEPLNNEIIKELDWTNLSRIQWSEFASKRNGRCEVLDQNGSLVAQFAIHPHDKLVGVRGSFIFMYRFDVANSRSILYSYRLSGLN